MEYDRVYSKHMDDSFKNVQIMSIKDLKEYLAHLQIELEYLKRRVTQIPKKTAELNSQIDTLQLEEEELDTNLMKFENHQRWTFEEFGKELAKLRNEQVDEVDEDDENISVEHTNMLITEISKQIKSIKRLQNKAFQKKKNYEDDISLYNEVINNLDDKKQILLEKYNRIRDKEKLLASLFAYYDVDNSGSISKDEMKACIKSVSLTEPLSTELADKMFSDFDTDDSGTISFDEFVNLFNQLFQE